MSPEVNGMGLNSPEPRMGSPDPMNPRLGAISPDPISPDPLSPNSSDTASPFTIHT